MTFPLPCAASQAQLLLDGGLPLFTCCQRLLKSRGGPRLDNSEWCVTYEPNLLATAVEQANKLNGPYLSMDYQQVIEGLYRGGANMSAAVAPTAPGSVLKVYRDASVALCNSTTTPPCS